jgi:hypothetical protein
MSGPAALVISFSPSSSSSESSSDEDEEMEITDASSSEEDGYALSAPIVKHVNNTQTIYTSTNPKSPTGSPTSPTFQRMTEDEQNMVRGLELELQTATAVSGRDAAATDGGISGTYWPHVHDGIFVVG